MTGASNSSLWVEMVGDIIVARARGVITEALVMECQERVLQLLRDTGSTKVMYDALEVERPTVQVALTQQTLTARLKEFSVRTAILVSNSAVAYLARLAFGEGDYRVFYNDLAGAFRWLAEHQPPAKAAAG